MLFMASLQFMLAAAAAAPGAADLPRTRYARRIPLVVEGCPVKGPLEGFPLLIRLKDGRGDAFRYRDVRQMGRDIAFTDDSGKVVLPHEVDTWKPGHESIVRVRVPALANGLRIWMHYGSAVAEDCANPSALWRDYVGVWHMNEPGNGVVEIRDSSGNALAGATHEKSRETEKGMFGGARLVSPDFGPSAKNGRIVIPDRNGALDRLVPRASLSGWFRMKKCEQWAYLFTRKGEEGDPTWALQFGSADGGTQMRVWAADGSRPEKTFDYGDSIERDTWHRFDVVFDDGTYSFYLDGEGYSAGGGRRMGKTSNPLSIGGLSGEGYGTFAGDVDEVRARAGVLSPDWIKAEYAQDIGTMRAVPGASVRNDASPMETRRPGGGYRESFTPGELWYDDNGYPINAHGGGVMKDGDTWWWYGEHKIYGPRGNGAYAGVHAYSSKNLLDWVDEGIVLPVNDIPKDDLIAGCIIERPKVVKCPKTGKYVMYFHLELKGRGYDEARVGLAVADNPRGEFSYRGSRRPLGNMSRDMTVFQDDDGRAYLVYSSEGNATMHISELTDDYCDFTGKDIRLGERDWSEAPAVCRKDGWYFILASGCSGWAPNAARLYRARKIEGPWERVGNPATGVRPANGLGSEKTWGCQSTHILKVSDKMYIAMFDEWRPMNAMDGRYIWLPIKFDGAGGLEIPWRDEWGRRARR